MENDMKRHAFPKANAKVRLFWAIFQMKTGIFRGRNPDGCRRISPPSRDEVTDWHLLSTRIIVTRFMMNNIFILYLHAEISDMQSSKLKKEVMLTKKEIKSLITSNAELFRQYGISNIGLFGSYASQEQKEDSDIDILIDFERDKETFDNFMSVCNLLEQVFTGHRVEVVTKGGLSPYIGPHILKNTEYVQISN